MTTDFVLRPMRGDDVEAVERLTAEGFYDLEMRSHRPGRPEPRRRASDEADRWRRRLRHIREHDAGGCWVAEDEGGLLGAAASIRRELMWALSTLVVRPGEQGRGVGRLLLEAAQEHGRGCLRGMVSSSGDPRAARRYRLGGLTLHPQMTFHGPLDRGLLPVVERVREGSIADVDLLDSVDRQVRAAAHGVDHEVLAEQFRLVVADRSTGSGYAYIGAEGGTALLAATSRRTATDLLWEALAATPPGAPARIRHLTAANEWAIDVGMAARLELGTEGYLALRGLGPPAPYLPNGHFL